MFAWVTWSSARGEKSGAQANTIWPNCDDLLVLGSLRKHLTAAHLRLPSVASNVDIAEDVRFKFQIIQAVLNHVAYADNANQLAVAKHRHVAHAMAGHQAHQVGEIIPERRGDQAVRHDVLYLHRRNWLAVLRKRAHNITFGDNTENSVVARHH